MHKVIVKAARCMHELNLALASACVFVRLIPLQVACVPWQPQEQRQWIALPY